MDFTAHTVKYFVGEGLWSSIWASREAGDDDETWDNKKKAAAIKVATRNITTWRAILQESFDRNTSPSFASVAMEGLLTNYNSLAIAENIKSDELNSVSEMKFHNDLLAIAKSASPFEKTFRALCNLAVSLKNGDIILKDKMRGDIRKFKRAKRRKNRIILLLSIICIFLMAIVLSCILL
jgi:hypothetical protein